MTETGYAPVNGLQMYYESHGDGDGTPLVVLHGAYQTGSGAGMAGMGEYVGPLSKGRRVITVDFQGHGRTANIDRQIRYETLADDVAADQSGRRSVSARSDVQRKSAA